MNGFSQALSNDSENYAETVRALQAGGVETRNHAIDAIEDLKDNYEAASKTVLEVTGLAELAGGGKVLKLGKYALNKGMEGIKGLLSGGVEDANGVMSAAPDVANNLASDARTAVNSAKSTFNNLLGKTQSRISQGMSDIKPGSFLDRNPGASNVGIGEGVEMTPEDANAAKVSGWLKNRGQGFENQKLSTRGSLNSDPNNPNQSNLRQSQGETKQSQPDPEPETKQADNLGDDINQETKVPDPAPTKPSGESKMGDDGEMDWSEDEDEGEEEAGEEAGGEEGDEIAGGIFDMIGLPEIGAFFQVAGAVAGVGIGVADAVKSGLAGDAATTLRDKALPNITPPTFDVGGSIVAPTTSSLIQ